MAAAFGRSRRGSYRQAKSDIVEHRHMTEQRVMLEHETDLAIARVQAADVGAVEANMPAGLMLKPGDNAQQREVFPEPDSPSNATI